MKAYYFIYAYMYIILFAKSMSFVHIVISILDDSFFAQVSFVSKIQVLQFVHSVICIYRKGPLSKFQPGAPCNLNPLPPKYMLSIYM